MNDLTLNSQELADIVTALQDKAIAVHERASQIRDDKFRESWDRAAIRYMELAEKCEAFNPAVCFVRT